jgi:transcriptional regulator with XRE-family HTH domain
LGIAKRHIAIKYAQKSRNWNQSKPLVESIKTIGDWIQVKRTEKNLTPGHVAGKMGIATALVLTWEAGSIQPNERQLKVLADLFEVDPLKEVVGIVPISRHESEKASAVCQTGTEAQAV